MNVTPEDPRETGTPLPQAIEAEQNVIGGLMLANGSLPEVSAWLRPEDFFRADHAAIYSKILDFAAAEPPKLFDSVTLGEWFESNGARIEGSYLVSLVRNTASVANIAAYGEIVREKAQLRRLVATGSNLVAAGTNSGGRRSDEIAMEATSALLGLTAGAKLRGAKPMREIANRWFEELEARFNRGGAMIGLPTPWAKLNELTHGLCGGDLIIVAGRPSMGKSAVAVNLATSAALSDKRVLFFNLEMTDVSIFNRCVASIAEVPLSALRNGAKGQDGEEWARIVAAMRRLRASSMDIDDTAGLTAQQIVSRAKREHLRTPVNLIIVDHLHLLKLGGGDRVDREIGEATSALKSLGKALGCPVVLLSQLNRGLEARSNKRPQMQDLRESGAIEQDADLILFVYRDDYYAQREGRASEFPGWVELFVAKQREGEAGQTVWMRDRLSIGLLEDCDGEMPQRQPAASKPVVMMSRLRSREGAAAQGGGP